MKQLKTQKRIAKYGEPQEFFLTPQALSAVEFISHYEGFGQNIEHTLGKYLTAASFHLQSSFDIEKHIDTKHIFYDQVLPNDDTNKAHRFSTSQGYLVTDYINMMFNEYKCRSNESIELALDFMFQTFMDSYNSNYDNGMKIVLPEKSEVRKKAMKNHDHIMVEFLNLDAHILGFSSLGVIAGSKEDLEAVLQSQKIIK